ncbi:MAG: hypothetical protein R3E97_16850 [Candidatus Eisenbacteria bacterium]
MIGTRTVRSGQRVAIWSNDGKVRYVDGPDRLLLWGQIVQDLHRATAETDQYLKVRFRDGTTQHLPGPCDVWHDPVLHDSIETHDMLRIDAHEALVIYRPESGGQVSRRVLRGPSVYMPLPEEWLHEFSWHGADPKDPRRKIPHALQFKRLRVIPDQTYIDVEDVRTADDALLIVQLMVFFELVDVEQMLDQTHDPIADFLNAVTADMIYFAASRPFETFKRETEKLNEIESYANLTARASRIGYRVAKVVYRGYEASETLQNMHDQAIEARTALQLQAETERQEQELADLRLSREAARSEEQRALERARVEHEQAMKRLAGESARREREDDHRLAVASKKELDGLALVHTSALNLEEAKYIQSLGEMGVDLTRYLVAQSREPDRLIRVEGAGSEGTRLHLHEPLSSQKEQTA